MGIHQELGQQQLVTQQREDRITQEEARRAHEAQLSAIQREAA